MTRLKRSPKVAVSAGAAQSFAPRLLSVNELFVLFDSMGLARRLAGQYKRNPSTAEHAGDFSMTQATTLNHKRKAARRATKRVRRTGSLQKVTYVPIGIRITKTQRDAVNELSAALLMHKSDLIRKGIDMALDWASARAKRFGTITVAK